MLAALLRMAALVTLVSASAIEDDLAAANAAEANADAILAQMLGVNKTTTNKDDARMQWLEGIQYRSSQLVSSAVISESEGKTIISETRVVSGVQYKRTIEYFRGDESLHQESFHAGAVLGEAFSILFFLTFVFMIAMTACGVCCDQKENEKAWLNMMDAVSKRVRVFLRRGSLARSIQFYSFSHALFCLRRRTSSTGSSLHPSRRRASRWPPGAAEDAGSRTRRSAYGSRGRPPPSSVRSTAATCACRSRIGTRRGR